MHFIYVSLIIILATLVLVFTFQNLELVTVAFLNAQITLPRAAMIAVIYFMGMLTGGIVTAAVKSWIRGASRK